MSMSAISGIAVGCVLAFMAPSVQAEETGSFLRVRRSVLVDKCWTGASMEFEIATVGDRQYAAYYDADRWMTVACRSLDSTEWQRKRLPDQCGWDSHNHVTFAFDSEGQMHVSGNMHNRPLQYYRTTSPGDISTLTAVHKMTGDREDRVTYPRFLTGPHGELLFTYRDGGSGNGSNIVNVYDATTRTWKRYLDKVLFDGEGRMSVYYRGPILDGNGTYHLAWEWRDTPNVNTNHDVSYAQSPGSLDNWRKSDGTPLALPLTIRNCEIIDSAQPGSGLIQPCLSVDGLNRPLVTYLKFDPKGRTQVYIMRLENGRWKRYQTTRWSERWEAEGYGILDHPIMISPPGAWGSDGSVYQVFLNRHSAPYEQIRFLDARKLQTIGSPMRLFPPEYDMVRTSSEGDWHVKTNGLDIGKLRQGGSIWVLRRECMRPNRDRPRESVPPPSKLEVVELEIAHQS